MAATRAALVEELREQVAPTVLAAERVLPVPAMLTSLFPDGGIVCGRSIVCDGPLSTTLAATLIAPSIVAGSWACLIDLPAIGVDALCEQGVPLERVVAVDGRPDRWVDLVSAAADGFDVIVTSIPGHLSRGALRRLTERLRRRGAVFVAIGAPLAERPDTPAAPARPPTRRLPRQFGDTILTTVAPRWSGLDDGAGHLRTCDVEIVAGGRRLPRTRRQRVSLVSRER